MQNRDFPQNPPVPKLPPERITPLEGFILCRRVPYADTLKPKLIELPENYAEAHKTQKAVVLAVGSDESIIPVGSTILVGRWAGTETAQEGDPDLFIVREDEILAVVG